MTYRDVIILDENNRVAAVYNLTAHDLGQPENRADFVAILTGLASHL